MDESADESYAPALTVVLFYKYVRIEDTSAAEEAQRLLCTRLGLTGRVRLAGEGINGHLAGTAAAVAEYQRHNDGDALFREIQYKLSQAEGCPFGGELFLRVTSEITSTGPQMQHALPTALGGKGGQHLCAQEFHQAVLRCQQDASPSPPDAADAADDADAAGPLPRKRKSVLIDTRNHYETAVGTFAGAVDPKLRTFAQFPGWIAANQSRLKDADVYLFCTGGIRCEKASAHLQSLGLANSVSQLAGGIHSYLEEFSPEARGAGLRTAGATSQFHLQPQPQPAGGGRRGQMRVRVQARVLRLRRLLMVKACRSGGGWRPRRGRRGRRGRRWRRRRRWRGRRRARKGWGSACGEA